MNKYENWHPTQKHPMLESQVAQDLRDLLNPSKEVLDRLADRDSNLELQDILDSFKIYIQNQVQTDLTSTITRSLVEAGAQALEPVIKTWLKRLLGSGLVGRGRIVLPKPITKPGKREKI